ncbi:hypothetical protein HELRODRAFT_68203, partial [Helobdella robusta]|uniref:WSC domain-containing protein n=1 Tax=Helobdella robusta TaxID=6412 RepID=T1FZB5_HELRO
KYFSTSAPVTPGYLGCYNDVDAASDKDLNLANTNQPAMTIESCITYCLQNDYLYAGLQAGRNCYCGNSYGKHGKALDSDCNSKCAGSITETCGGTLKNSIYSRKHVS